MNTGFTEIPDGARGLWDETAPPAPWLGELQGASVAEIAVIGAGYTGLSAALHLARAGKSVTVIEAADVGYGGSGRNVGLVNAGMWIRPDAVCAALGADRGERLLRVLGEAPAEVFELIQRHGIACEAERRGTLHCAVGASGLRDLEIRAAQWRSRGAPVELLGAADTARKVGSAAYAGSLWDHRAGTLQPLAYVRGLARAALDAGARVLIKSPVLRAESGTEWTLHAPRGSVRAPWVIVATDAYATGPWSEVDREQIHLPYFNLSTEPLDSGLLREILPERQGAWDTEAVLSSFRLDRAGRLVFGSIGALQGAGARVHEQWARRAMARLFPQLGAPTFRHGWYGNIGMTSDRLPRFHELAPRVIAFSGYNGRGIAPGAVFGRLLAQLVLGEIGVDDLPLPASGVRGRVVRELRGYFYRKGAELAHWVADR